MKFVKKSNTPQFFINDTIGLANWSEYYGSKKRKLKEYILENEQYYLCIYCEMKVVIEQTHIEHLKPKGIPLYKHLIYDYNNLGISCNGICHNIKGDDNPSSCGHVKKSKFDNDLFLNPTEIEDLSNYFEYEYDSFGNVQILSSPKNPIKSNYMINELLELNCPELTRARKIVISSLKRSLIKIEGTDKKNKLISILKKNDSAFISFLKYSFADVLT